jgi:hypothetical protein
VGCAIYEARGKEKGEENDCVEKDEREGKNEWTSGCVPEMNQPLTFTFSGFLSF